MRFRSLSIIAASTVMCLTPLAMAHAQSYGSLDQREGWLNSRIDRARDDGSIDRYQARQLHNDVRDIRIDQDRMRDNDDGVLSGYDRDNLQARLDAVTNRLDDMSDNAF